MNVSLDMLDEAPDNPRERLGDLTDLAKSIVENGIIQPLTVTPTTAGRYLVVAGHRRLAAARLAGLTEAPVSVREMRDDERVAAMIVENVHRRQLTKLERAKAFKRLMDDHGLTQREVARRVGCHETTVGLALQALKTPEERAAELLAVRSRRMAGETVVGRPTVDTSPQAVLAKVKEGASGQRGVVSLSYDQCRTLLRMVTEGAQAVARERQRARAEAAAA